MSSKQWAFVERIFDSQRYVCSLDWLLSTCLGQKTKINCENVSHDFIFKAQLKQSNFLQMVLNNPTSGTAHLFEPIISIYSSGERHCVEIDCRLSSLAHSSKKKKYENTTCWSILPTKYTSRQCLLLYNGGSVPWEPLVMTNLPDEALIAGQW